MNKIALDIGIWQIHWYGVLVAAGFLFGLWNASRRAVHVNIKPDSVMNLGPWAILGGIIGARLLYVISYWNEYFSHEPLSEIFMIQHGGLVYYGGLIGAVIVLIFYMRINQLPVWLMADILVPSLALGHVFGRLGCLMNGCCYGSPLNAFFALHFPKDHETHGVGVHPTQIYEATLNLALFLALAYRFKYRRFEGELFALYLMGYAVLRATVECFRGDYQQYYGPLHLTPAQLVSAVMFVAGAMFYAWKLKTSKPDPA